MAAAMSFIGYKRPSESGRAVSGKSAAFGVDSRLVVRVSFMFGRVLVKLIGTHAEYDRIDASTVSQF